ncbi:MAG: hypothetical protein ABW101_11730 [Candidatus Thiodiazotropha sp.]
MMKPMLFGIAFCAIVAGGCADQQSLTQEELHNQSRVDAVVSGVLFENELDEVTSYNIRKDGFVVIRFAPSVPSEKYNQVVDQLRSDDDVPGLRAEQGGKEICPVNGYR